MAGVVVWFALAASLQGATADAPPIPIAQAVERALPALGFEGVRNVHIGRLVELDVEDASQLPAMCEQLLANPLVEDYEIVA